MFARLLPLALRKLTDDLIRLDKVYSFDMSLADLRIGFGSWLAGWLAGLLSRKTSKICMQSEASTSKSKPQTVEIRLGSSMGSTLGVQRLRKQDTHTIVC